MSNLVFSSRNRMPQQLGEQLKAMIARGGLRRGDALPSYRELCQRFGVSLVTMKRAMDQLAAEGVVHIQPQKGVFVERAIAPRSPKLSQIGIVFYCSRQLLFSQRYLMEILQGLMLESEMRGADARIFSLKNEGPMPPEELETSGVDGLILVGTANRPYLENIARQPLPAVAVDVFTPGIALDYVVADNTSAATRVVDHLAGLGHKRIAYLDGWSTDTINDTVIESSDVLERREATCAAAMTLGLESCALFRVDAKNPDQTTEQAVDQWLGMSSRPTAIVAYDENLARRLMEAFSKRGVRAPEDVSIAAVACAGELSSGAIMTSSKLDFTGMGRKAVQLLAERCQSPRLEAERVWRIGGEFIIGQTAAAISN